MNTNYYENLEWELNVPIFRNPTIMKQLSFAVGLPFGLLILILFITTGDLELVRNMIIVLAILFSLTYLFIRIVYGGNYDVGFTLDSKGILCYTQAKQAKKNKIINGLTVTLGLLSGKPSGAGAGMLAQSRQSVLVKWKNIRKVKYKPNQHLIMVKGGFAENIAVFCTKENYAYVEAVIRQKTNGLAL